jgi:acyl-CoA thioesterase
MFEKDALAKLLGIEIIDIKPGYAKTTLQVNPDLVNSLAMTHGATVFALMDMALAAASNSQGKVAVALSVNINFMQATYVGDRLYAIATEEKLTNRTGIYRIIVETEKGEKVAVATGTVYRTGARPKP